MSYPQLLPGIEDKHVEFYGSHPEEMKMIHDGRRWSFSEFPQRIIQAIEREIERRKSDIRCVKQYIYTHFRGLDTYPDMTEDGVFHYTEYCEGDKTLLLPNGNKLTCTQIKVLSIMYKPVKIIAFELGTSKYTAETHVTNIMKAIGVFTQKEAIVYGVSVGIINHKNLKYDNCN